MTELVSQLINRTINCHDFIEQVESQRDEEYIKILIELCQHKDKEQSIICFSYLYQNSYNRWALDRSLLKTDDINEIKAEFGKMTQAENKNPALVSNFYSNKDDQGKELFTFDDLKRASEEGDALAPCIIGHELNNEASIPYFKLAVKRGDYHAAFELMEIYFGKNRKIKVGKNMDKVYKYYVKGKKIKENFDLDPNIYLEDPKLFAELLHYIYLQLTEKDESIKKKEEMITELLYEPGGRMYQEAKEHFENCKL